MNLDESTDYKWLDLGLGKGFFGEWEKGRGEKRLDLGKTIEGGM